MTQEVQPLTWSKRTNIEEHQQFFSKINEIIGNLAPTVDEAEQAIAQATQAVTDANAAITTANAASAAADAAAQQAQTAANAVAGYNTRLIAVEDEAAGNTANITDLQDRMGTAEGKITALQGVQGDYVKKAGAAQTVTSQIMVPTTATGTKDTQIANGTRIQNDLDAYTHMVRTTGAQSIVGNKTFTDLIIRRVAFFDINTMPDKALSLNFLNFVDKNEVSAGNIGGVETRTQSYRTFTNRAKMSDGSIKSLSLQLRIDRETNKFVVQVAWPDGTYSTLAEKTIS